jgi:hypothetical protein
MQKQKSIIVFLVLIFSLGLFNSCEKFTFKDDILPSTYIVKFSSDIVPIFSERGCTASSCHGGAQPLNLKVNPYQSLIKNGDIDLNTPSQSILYQYITPTGKMYQITTVSSWDRQLILQWIVQGANNN